ncbi:MAG: BREX system ATP-binding domain-containing protein [Sphaerochaetaceae bacterium]
MTFDYPARHMIEALRSGIPSRAVGRYFSESRGEILQEIIHDLDGVRTSGVSKGRVINGKYGEGKTHLLNTVFSLAHSHNMVVSMISLSKETPFDKLYHVYKSIVNNTYLPNHIQPGFMEEFEALTPSSQQSNELLLYAAKQLETDRLYYVLRAFLNSDDQDERYLLQTDLEGDFVANLQVKQIYGRIFGEKIKFSVNFVKSQHYQDYFAFLSRFFLSLGYSGWVLLFDETELTGRLGKKTRLKAYANMAEFLFPNKRFSSMYSLFAISSSYTEDVIEGKHEFESLQEWYPDESGKPIRLVLEALSNSTQLVPLTKSEIREIVLRLIDFHGRSYAWTPQVDIDDLLQVVDSSGYLLRTKIRSAIEYLDQLYQYGDAGSSSVQSVYSGTLDEDDMPELDDILQ